MPRYVLLEFESTAQADAFVEKTLDKSEQGARFWVRGYFYKPAKWCECPRLSETRKRKECFLNKKYGYVVHRNCGRPRAYVSNCPRNLLDPIDAPGRMKTAFLTLMGDWRGKQRAGTPLENYPISVAQSKD